ncbi:ATP-binding protein [Paenibacillus filicis]|uniref:ATP-binding protein n=1 Tax=Paenibacillus filicis TaxID=669464 RepID=A0ABU9DIF4_9BACL
MEVRLPSQFDSESMYSFISNTLNEENEPHSNEISFDFRPLEFITPVGVTVLSNLIGKLMKHGTKVSFVYRAPNRLIKFCPIAFLDDSMFFKHYLGNSLDGYARLRPTTLPLSNVTYAKSHDYLTSTMVWLASKLSLTKKSLGDVETCMKEVFNNIKDHSSEKIGSVFVQQYPRNNTVMFAISDFGVGIPFHIQRIHPSLSDGEAIRLAVQEGFTTKTSPRNRGAGLDFLLHNVVKNNKGFVYIHSNRGILNCTGDGNGGIKFEVKNTAGFYPGTLLEINFRTDTIENEEEEFLWE